MPRPYLNEAGSFECLVTTPESGWIAETPEKKTPYLRLPLVVNDPSNPENNGQEAIWRGWLSDKAFDNTIVRLKEVFGFDGDLTALCEGKTTLAGLPCNITTEIQEYLGKPRCVVAWLNPPGGGGAKPMDAEKLVSILSKLSARGKAIAKSVQGPPPVSPAPSPATSTSRSAPGTPSTTKSPTGSPESAEDDVPF